MELTRDEALNRVMAGMLSAYDMKFTHGHDLPEGWIPGDGRADLVVAVMLERGYTVTVTRDTWAIHNGNTLAGYRSAVGNQPGCYGLVFKKDGEPERRAQMGWTFGGSKEWFKWEDEA